MDKITTITGEDLQNYLNKVERTKSGFIKDHIDRLLHDAFHKNRGMAKQVADLKLKNWEQSKRIRELEDQVNRLLKAQVNRSNLKLVD